MTTRFLLRQTIPIRSRSIGLPRIRAATTHAAATTSTAAPAAPPPPTPAGTIPTTTSAAHELLVSQRLSRPLSPHLSIYQPQLTWYGSAANRITGVALSGLIYGYFIGYGLGVPGFDVASLASSVAALPWAVKVAGKVAVALPFTYHSLNSLRHLAWDMARLLDIRDVYRTGYAVLALTAVVSVWLVSL